MRNINDPKIRKYIEELEEEYKELLFDALLMKSNSIDNLSVSDLLKIDDEVKKHLRNSDVKDKNGKYISFGVMYIKIGIFMYLFSSIIISFDDLRHLSPKILIQMVSITIVFAGFTISIYPLFHKYKKNTRVKEDKLLEYDVIGAWRELEGLCNDIDIKENIMANRSVIKLLAQLGLITNEEENELHSFLKLRNSIVHNSNETSYNSEDIMLNLKNINVIINKVRKKISSDLK